MGGAVPPLPQYAFMAWCSVRGSTGTTSLFISLKNVECLLRFKLSKYSRREHWTSYDLRTQMRLKDVLRIARFTFFDITGNDVSCRLFKLTVYNWWFIALITINVTAAGKETRNSRFNKTSVLSGGGGVGNSKEMSICLLSYYLNFRRNFHGICCCEHSFESTQEKLR
jgi:hypothetical protein